MECFEAPIFIALTVELLIPEDTIIMKKIFIKLKISHCYTSKILKHLEHHIFSWNSTQSPDPNGLDLKLFIQMYLGCAWIGKFEMINLR